MKIGIVTDSTADIPNKLIAKHDIHIIPALMILNQQTIVDDGSGISREAFYQELSLPTSVATTATPSLEAFSRLYRELFEQGYEKIISIHPPAKLSGLFSNAITAAKEFGDRILVIDSGTVSMGQGFQVLEASNQIKQEAPIGTIIETLNAFRKRVKVFAMLDTLKYVQKSGRASWVTARIGGFIDLKALIEVREGVIHKSGLSRTRKKGIRLLKSSLESLGLVEELCVLHSNALEDAEHFISQTKHLIIESGFIKSITPTLGTHVGPRCLGFACVLAEDD